MKMPSSIFIIFFVACLFCVEMPGFRFPLQAEEPWGKEADLVGFKPSCCSASPVPSESPIAKLGQGLIRFHQEVISPADGPRSHFIPSSSQYTRDAITRYGFFFGVVLGCDRLMRENDDPWVYRKAHGNSGILKYDPVK